MAAKKITKSKKTGKKGTKGSQTRTKSRSAKQAAGEKGGRGELLDMDQAIAILKTTRPTFYRWLRNGRVRGMKVGRQWRFYREDLDRFLAGRGPRIDVPADLSPLIQTLKREIKEAGAAKLLDSEPAAAEEPIDRAVGLMILLGVAKRASDIHIHPTNEDRGPAATTAVMRLRIDGVLHETVRFDKRLLDPIARRWKSISGCDVAEENRPQDGRTHEADQENHNHQFHQCEPLVLHDQSAGETAHRCAEIARFQLETPELPHILPTCAPARPLTEQPRSRARLRGNRCSDSW